MRDSKFRRSHGAVKQDARNKVIQAVSVAAKASGKKRLALRKAKIESLAEKSGAGAEFHLRVNAKGILPWPPVDVLALLPAPDIAGAVVALAEQAELVRSLVDTSTHLTIMPSIDGITFPALAKSGYHTLFPDAEGAIAWVDELGLRQASSSLAGLFGEVLSLAGELGALDQKGLGTEARPKEEIAARRSLEAAFAGQSEELIRYLDVYDQCLQTSVSELTEYLRSGNVDFAAEAKASFDGTSSEIIQATGDLFLRLIESEFYGSHEKSRGW